MLMDELIESFRLTLLPVNVGIYILGYLNTLHKVQSHLLFTFVLLRTIP